MIREEIDNQIKIMLKGAANYSNISDIKNKLMNKQHLRIKLGLDPSAPDIHLGHAVVLRKIRQLQDLGHEAIIIIGDYTGMIGDPTGKSKTRKQLSDDEIKNNAKTYQEQIKKILNPAKTQIRYNSEWLSKLNFADIINLTSKCTVARMLERDDFHNRFSKHLPLSIHEFLYPLMQAYDSVAVKADLELGGTDQTFNIMMGRNIQKDYNIEPQLILLMPLLEGIDGKEKMSKSLGNYIGIDEPVKVIYEKVMKIPDELIVKYYELCTDIHPDVIKDIERKLALGENPRDIKMQLAFEITKTYSDTEQAQIAQDSFVSFFQKNTIPDDIPTISVQSGGLLSDNIMNELVGKKYFKSKNEIKRILQQGGVKFNGETIYDMDNIRTEASSIIKIGKRKYFRLIIL